MTEKNTRIFIDTNYFLDIYRKALEIEELDLFMKCVYVNRKYLINTEQSNIEFLRNRVKVLATMLENLKKENLNVVNTTFLSNIPEVKEYFEMKKKLEMVKQKVEKSLESRIAEKNKDKIYNLYKKLWNSNNTFLTTDEILNNAWKRQLKGSPPGTDKKSAGDEIIWETFLGKAEFNLIVVSGDKTYKQNAEFLKNEYKERTRFNLEICETPFEAFKIIGLELQGVLETRWVDIVRRSLENLGSRASLKDLYAECKKESEILYGKASTTMNATVRKILQMYCSESIVYVGKKDLFRRVEKGIWELKS